MITLVICIEPRFELRRNGNLSRYVQTCLYHAILHTSLVHSLKACQELSALQLAGTRAVLSITTSAFMSSTSEEDSVPMVTTCSERKTMMDRE